MLQNRCLGEPPWFGRGCFLGKPSNLPEAQPLTRKQVWARVIADFNLNQLFRGRPKKACGREKPARARFVGRVPRYKWLDTLKVSHGQGYAAYQYTIT